MKNTMKVLAAVMALVMVLALSAAAFAEKGPVSLDQAKQIALEQAGVKASEASFTKAYKDWDDDFDDRYGWDRDYDDFYDWD